MKLHLESIDVQLAGTAPTAVCWRGGVYPVQQVIDTWWSAGPWWEDSEERTYLLIETTSGVMEIFRSSTRGWMLARTFE